jgi:hypothetical protein
LIVLEKNLIVDGTLIFFNSLNIFKLITSITYMVSREATLFRERVRSLKDKLVLTEGFPVLYSGVSPAFLQYSRIIDGTYPIPMTERPGSIAGLAKRKLEMQFAEENIPSYQRYTLGRRLGFSPEQIHIMHKDIGKYFKFVMPEKSSSEKGFEEEIRARKDELDYKKACEEFERLFPEERSNYFFAVQLELNSRKNAYNVRVLSVPYKPFLLSDPITPEDMQLLFDHLMSLAGPQSKKMMLEAA